MLICIFASDQITHQMNILVSGADEYVEQVRQKAGDAAQVLFWEGSAAELEAWSEPVLVIDYAGLELPMLDVYDGLPSGSLVMLPVAEYALYELKQSNPESTVSLAGFNHWPSQLSNAVIELSAFQEEDKPIIANWMQSLSWDYELVQDQIGLVTQRVIAMVINEAYLTLQEGTATAADIDMSMRLGVNYPFGPFEWGQRLGLANILTLLDSLRNKTGDPRYNASLLLRHEVARQSLA